MKRLLSSALTVLALAGVLAAAPASAEPELECDGPTRTWFADGVYSLSYSPELWLVVPECDVAVPLTWEDWAELGFPAPRRASTDVVKYPWSPAISAVTFWGPARDQWLWQHLDLAAWTRAGRPAPRTAGWIEGSSWYKWATSDQLLVEDAGGINHVLTYAEWRDAGFPGFEDRSNEGFYKLRWDSSGAVVRYDEISPVTSWSPQGRVIGYAEWAEEGFPAPKIVDRLPGDIGFVQPAGSSRIIYSSSAYRKSLTYDEWRAAGFPAPTPGP